MTLTCHRTQKCEINELLCLQPVVYAVPIENVEHLKQRIKTACEKVRVCRFFLRQEECDTSFARKILWTHECTFTNNGIFNRHDEHAWCTENPHMKRCRIKLSNTYETHFLKKS
ncbi:hypothetical protein WH47_08620 [Habropoda laboriosa]|uniref:Uncharacterized protein n=1 Tax=Habropoda laboriosa TaxID=597456 RepID=A0A0L7QPJ7_9HYME|nr:hypothetical protein WH47_08620 [Habropoda laboriosa]